MNSPMGPGPLPLLILIGHAAATVNQPFRIVPQFETASDSLRRMRRSAQWPAKTAEWQRVIEERRIDPLSDESLVLLIISPPSGFTADLRDKQHRGSAYGARNSGKLESFRCVVVQQAKSGATLRQVLPGTACMRLGCCIQARSCTFERAGRLVGNIEKCKYL